MFKTLDELIRFNRPRTQRVRERIVQWAGGFAVAALNFKAILLLLSGMEA